MPLQIIYDVYGVWGVGYSAVWSTEYARYPFKNNGVLGFDVWGMIYGYDV